jgi:hypothetical protein
MSDRFYRNPNGTGFCRRSNLVRFLAKERPGAQPEGPCEAGIGQRRECLDRALVLLGRRHPATGSHLPLEDTAPPYAVSFASSPFAHPILQTRRRASEDLFRASLSVAEFQSLGTYHAGPGTSRLSRCLS